MGLKSTDPRGVALKWGGVRSVEWIIRVLVEIEELPSRAEEHRLGWGLQCRTG
jgi:hypothetical protein